MQSRIFVPMLLAAALPAAEVLAATSSETPPSAPSALAQNQEGRAPIGAPGSTREMRTDDIERRDDYDPTDDTTTGGEIDQMDNRTRQVEEAGKVPSTMEPEGQREQARERREQIDEHQAEEKPWYQFWD